MCCREASSQGRAGTGNSANARESSTKGSTKSLGTLAQTFGKPAVSTARHGARTLWGSFSAGPGKTCCRNKRQQEEPPVGLEAGSQLKSQGKWLGVVGTFLWDFTYLCWNLTIFKNDTKPTFEADEAGEGAKTELDLAQWKALIAFIKEWCEGVQDGQRVFTAALNRYQALDQFEQVLEKLLVGKLNERFPLASDL